MASPKKKIIKSLENLSGELQELLHDQYPNGYETSITRIMNAKNEPIFVFPLETDDAVYLVKIPATKNSDGGYDVASSKPQEFEDSGDSTNSFDGGGDDFDNNDDFDNEENEEDENKRSSREGSYDPDFDS